MKYWVLRVKTTGHYVKAGGVNEHTANLQDAFLWDEPLPKKCELEEEIELIPVKVKVVLQ